MSEHHSICKLCEHKCCYGVTATQAGDENTKATLIANVCDNSICNFHNGDGCSIYELRPSECKNYKCDKLC